jgi:hypothetical protein
VDIHMLSRIDDQSIAIENNENENLFPVNWKVYDVNYNG